MIPLRGCQVSFAVGSGPVLQCVNDMGSLGAIIIMVSIQMSRGLGVMTKLVENNTHTIKSHTQGTTELAFTTHMGVEPV